MADAACSTNSVVSILVNLCTQAFVTISSCSTYCVPQCESHTLSTLLAVQGGYMLVIYGVKKDGQVLPMPTPHGGQWEWSLYGDCHLFAIVLGPGCMLYVYSPHSVSCIEHLYSLLPPGTPRAVFTVTPSGDKLQPCVMFGSRYFSPSTLVQSLHGVISASFGQVERMNARRDDWDVNPAKMLNSISIPVLPGKTGAHF